MVNGKFGNIWISDDRTEIAIEVVDDQGQPEVFILQAEPGRHGPEPRVTDCAVAPEALEPGWTFVQTS